MNEIELAAHVDFVENLGRADGSPTSYWTSGVDLTDKDVELANTELARRGSIARVARIPNLPQAE